MTSANHTPSVHDESGFTLIELLVAMAILAAGLLAVAGTLGYARGLDTVAEKENAATHIAERELETLSNLSYTRTALSSSSGDSQWTSIATTKVSPPLDLTKIVSDTTNGKVTPVSSGTDGQSGWTNTVGGNAYHGNIYRYVTSVSGSGAATYLRVTVAVTVAGGHPSNPVVLSETKLNPNVGSNGQVDPPVCFDVVGVDCG